MSESERLRGFAWGTKGSAARRIPGGVLAELHADPRGAPYRADSSPVAGPVGSRPAAAWGWRDVADRLPAGEAVPIAWTIFFSVGPTPCRPPCRRRRGVDGSMPHRRSHAAGLVDELQACSARSASSRSPSTRRTRRMTTACCRWTGGSRVQASSDATSSRSRSSVRDRVASHVPGPADRQTTPLLIRPASSGSLGADTADSSPSSNASADSPPGGKMPDG